MEKKFYSTMEAAKILRVSRISIFNRIRAGKIAAEKVGRNYNISREALFEALGEKVGDKSKNEIGRAAQKALKEYGETFKRLGKE